MQALWTCGKQNFNLSVSNVSNGDNNDDPIGHGMKTGQITGLFRQFLNRLAKHYLPAVLVSVTAIIAIFFADSQNLAHKQMAARAQVAEKVGAIQVNLERSIQANIARLQGWWRSWKSSRT